MDPDLGRFQVVWAAAGTATAVFPVAPATLRMLSNAHVAPICEERRQADVLAEGAGLARVRASQRRPRGCRPRDRSRTRPPAATALPQPGGGA